jgi:signal transduction histidine kinase
VVRIHYGTPAGLRGSAALTTVKPWLLMADQEWRRLPVAWRMLLLGLLALGLAGAGAAGHAWWRRRTIILVERRDTEARREERDRLARDLHDELGARLSRISLVTERLLHEDGPDAPAKRFAQVVSATATDLRQAMQALVGGLRHGPDTAGGVITMLEEQAGGLLQDTGVRLLRDLPDAVPEGRIPAAVTTALRPCLREALGNVLRHAQATEVWLRARVADGRLEVEVEDNGRGFEPALLPRRGGLDHLEQRARGAGGLLEVDSAPGLGTRVRFLLPLEVPAARR